MNTAPGTHELGRAGAALEGEGGEDKMPSAKMEMKKLSEEKGRLQ